MKISLAWAFDHVDGQWQDTSVNHLVREFNEKTAEIDAITKWSIDIDNIFVVQIKDIDKDVRVFCSETEKSYDLAYRSDAQVGGYYLVKMDNALPSWLKLSDVGGQKEDFLVQIHLDSREEKGEWRRKVEQEDYIFDIENKTITHRPDLWGHRGIAREISALLSKRLSALQNMLSDARIIEEQESYRGKDMPFSIDNVDPSACPRFAVCHFAQIANQPSHLNMALRLARIGIRPINAFVDATNYVMLDLSQPVHAFDAEKINSSNISVACNQKGKQLALLDDSVIELLQSDIAILARREPIALAGVMGGNSTSVDLQTNTLLVEAAYFEATHIRRSALLHKKRTEASTRFEKQLDPMQNVVALRRFGYLLKGMGCLIKDTLTIISLGRTYEDKKIEVAHSYIEKKVGTLIDPDFIKKVFSNLGFNVKLKSQDPVVYDILVPTFRATKDIQAPEDIVEEVVRFFGFGQIPKKLPGVVAMPKRQLLTVDHDAFKKIIAFGLRMREVKNYAVYDESFLQKIDWQPLSAVAIKNPVSSNWQNLVTSLVPHLFKNIEQNVAEHKSLRFFESNRVWNRHNQNVFEEHRVAGIFFERYDDLDFYQVKKELAIIFDFCRMAVEWQPFKGKRPSWLNEEKSAQLWHEGNLLGYAGNVSSQWVKKFGVGQAFIFDLLLQPILDHMVRPVHYKRLAKYPASYFDVSMFVPLDISFKKIEQTLLELSDFIKEVQLIDFYYLPSSQNVRAYTVRCTVQSVHKTLTSQEIDVIYQKALYVLQQLKITIR